ncbi:hypothetical protein [Methyloglobulus sp.]|uniref:hypothetical protein n=1 Tax=Methyloglobulus sp. TaxID=2518622 RepID=UPI0032B83031
MSDYQYQKLIGTEHIIMSIWLGLIVFALVATLFKCYKKRFVDNIAYQKHRQFWLRLAILLNLIGSMYTTEIITHYFGANVSFDRIFDLDKFLYFIGILPKQSLLFFIPVLILLAVSLIPAKLQNWLSKATHP